MSPKHKLIFSSGFEAFYSENALTAISQCFGAKFGKTIIIF